MSKLIDTIKEREEDDITSDNVINLLKECVRELGSEPGERFIRAITENYCYLGIFTGMHKFDGKKFIISYLQGKMNIRDLVNIIF